MENFDETQDSGQWLTKNACVSSECEISIAIIN
jgi:hypothetical protein